MDAVLGSAPLIEPLPPSGSGARRELVRRPPIPTEVTTRAAEVLDRVRLGGDAAVRELTLQFDGADVSRTLVEPSE
ncbi:MAG: hypothetical protein ACP5PW_06685, partial [Candidatus Dormibacteria bacterium]